MSELFTDRFTRFNSGNWGPDYADFDVQDGTAGVNGGYAYVDTQAYMFCTIPAGTANGGLGTMQFDFYVPADTTDGAPTGNWIYYYYGWPKANAPGLGAGWWFHNYLDAYAVGDGTWKVTGSSTAQVTFTPDPDTWYTAKEWLYTPGSSSRTIHVKVWKRGDPEPEVGDSGTSSSGNSPTFTTDYMYVGGGYTAPAWMDNIRVWNEIVLVTEEPTIPPIKPDPTVDIQIKYDGEDITENCVVAECFFTARANGAAGEAEVVVKDVAQNMVFIPGKTLELYLDGVRQWDGWAMSRRLNYWFEGHTANCYPCPHITPRKHILAGFDRNLLFQRRVLYNKADESIAPDNIWPANTPDEEVIEASIVSFLDDVDGIDYTTKVETVGPVDPYVEVRVPGPTNMFGQLLTEIAQEVGAVFYIDPDRYLVYTDVNNPDAPFVLTDKPTVVGEVGYRQMTLLNDGTAMVNDALVWGAGQGSPNMVYARVTDSNPNWFNLDDRLSVEIHGLHQNPNGYRPGVWHQGTVERIANSIVYGSPSNKRGHKDDKVSVELTLFTPGLRVAQKVEFHSESHDFTDVIPVRNLRISFPTPYNVRYEARLSHELDEPWTVYEPWFPGPRPRPEDPAIECTILHEDTGQGIFVGSANPVTDEDFLFLGTQDVIRGSHDSGFSIETDGFPPNKWTFTGDNNYESNTGGTSFTTSIISPDYPEPPILQSTSVEVEVDRWYADKYWYNNGSGDLQIEGEPLYRWENVYHAYKTPLNSDNPAWPVTAVMDVTLTMTGTMGDRDVTGHLFPLPGVNRNNVNPATGDWFVTFGTLIPERFFKEPHTTPSALWEGPMNSGDVVNFTYRLSLRGRAFYMLGVDFEQIVTTPQPWLDSIKVVASISMYYENDNPSGGGVLVGADEDGIPCIERNSLGRTCETAVLLSGLTYRVKHPYAFGTTRVSVDGLVLAGNGIQYTESAPARGEFTLEDEPTGEVYVCYDMSAYSTDLPAPEALFIFPVGTQYQIVGTFGSQMDNWGSYVWHGVYYPHFHNGVDFACPVGTPVYAAADGHVRIETQEAGGLMVHIYHDFYGFRTTYAHLSERLVEDGDDVIQGQIIGYSGESGLVTGPHLHWGLVVAGYPENPLPYTDYEPQVIWDPDDASELT